MQGWKNPERIAGGPLQKWTTISQAGLTPG